MSYDLTFWKQKQANKMAPMAIYGELLAGRAVEGLETIPTTEILARLLQKFPGITEDGGLVFWEGGPRGMFEMYSSNQHIHICCREISDGDMNTIIDVVAAEFDCPLYDPQVDKRFDR